MCRQPITRTPLGEARRGDKPLRYFGEADLQMPGLLGRSDSLLTTLTRNVLYHGDCAIPDIFLFGNPTLIKALSEREKTFRFLVSAVRQGALVPWFRADTGGSFEEALRAIWDSGVIGTDRDNALAIARQLDSSLQRPAALTPISYTYGIWPTDSVGARFLQNVEKYLGTNRTAPSGLERVWDDTKTMRINWVREAVARVDDGTLRRGDLITVIDQNLGHPERGEVRNVGELLRRISNQVDRRRVTTFLWWITHLYQLNQAELFGLEADLRIGRDAQLLVVAGREDPALPVDTDVQHFRVPVPRPYVLWGAADAILKLRSASVGRDYFAALAEWRLDPNPSTAANVREQLDHYSRQLLEVCTGGAVEYLCATLGIQKLDPNRIKGAKRALLGIAGLASQPPLSIVISLFDVALGVYEMVEGDAAGRAMPSPVAKWSHLGATPRDDAVRYLHEPVACEGQSS